MHQRQISVVEYNPAWREMFVREERLLRSALSCEIREVHHIGSTAVPGMRAKPTIDIMLELPSIELLDAEVDAMNDIGYRALGEYGIPGRRFFIKGVVTRSHHIHAFATGDPNLDRHIAFREYLRAHPDVAHEYGAIKTRVSATCDDDIDAYSDGKAGFVRRLEAMARVWYRQQR